MMKVASSISLPDESCSQEKSLIKTQEFSPLMNKYFILVSLDPTSFLVYPDSRYEHKPKDFRSIKIIIE